MATHKFRVGQKVHFVSSLLERNAPVGDYEIMRQLPDAYGEFYYRIKSTHESHERVVKEGRRGRPDPGCAR
jgi:hypothetical protein